MNMIDDIKRDRKEGRGNQWRLLETMSSATVMDGTCEVLSYRELESKANRANARRIARVPDMEAALIEAVEALQGLLALYQGQHEYRETTPEEIAAEYAIARATERATR